MQNPWVAIAILTFGVVAVKARMQPQGSELGLVEAINRVEVGFRAAFPQVRWIFFEPDISD